MTKSNLNLTDNVELMFFAASRFAGKGISELMEMEPDHRVTEHNVLTKKYREHFAKAINPGEDAGSFEATQIAFGDDDTPASISDEGLKNEVYRRDIDQMNTTGTEFNTISLLTADEANGENIVEWALVTEDGRAINRVVLDDPRLKPKTAEWAVAARVHIEYQDISEI